MLADGFGRACRRARRARDPVGDGERYLVPVRLGAHPEFEIVIAIGNYQTA
jgi:hypothetical protein